MSRLQTDRLIADLAQDGALARPVASPAAVLAGASVTAFAVALAMALVLLPELGAPARSPNPWLWWKLACMAALGAGAWVLVRELARPGYARPRLGLLAGGVAVMALGALADPSGLSVVGRSHLSVPSCLVAIVAQALPGLILILLGLKMSTTTTRPTLTGAAAGLLAGTFGAAAYALVCRNDGGVFVFVWYGLGVTLAAALGAFLGRRLLKW